MKPILLTLAVVFCGAMSSFGQAPTFTKDIAPIIYNHCTSCHRDGEIGPMPFTNYNEVASWANMIEYVTDIRYMPPWKADPNYSRFAGENFLEESEIQLIKDWVAAAVPMGDPADEPPLPEFPDGSVLGEPDLVLSMAESYTHYGGNEDEYRIFVIPTGLTEDKDLAALEVRPGNRQIVHHALISWDISGEGQLLDAQDPGYGYNGFGGFGISGAVDKLLPGYAPGQVPITYPDGIGQRLYAGSDLLVQMHYAPWPVPTTDSSTLNLFFKEEAVQRNVQIAFMVPLPGVLINGPFYIFPNEVKTFHGIQNVDQDISLIAINPHSHLLGKDWEVFVVSPSNDTTPLIRINDWDFNWQGSYLFQKLVKVEAGSQIHALATYDNTANNPNNPNNPPQAVTWGEKTTDEMYFLPFAFVPYQEGDENIDLTTDALDDLVLWPNDKLFQVFPNPTDGQVTIGFSLADHKRVSIDLLDLNGKLIESVLDRRYYPVGYHKHRFSVEGQPAGTYLVQIRSGDFVASKKLILH